MICPPVRSLAVLLVTACLVAGDDRIKRQISFGDDSSAPSSSSSSSSSSSFSGNGGGAVSFGDSSSSSNSGGSVSIKTILQDNPSIGTRARPSFSQNPGQRRYSSSCTTPNGEFGSCRYIFDSQCLPVLNAIIQQGITPQVLNYLYQAIRSPCGFENFDFTLCCASQGGQTTAPPPTPGPGPTPNQQCGIPSNGNRIIGGTVASPGQWPWAVILGKPSSNSFQVICGGTLINSNTVLTASHCFESASGPTHVRLGDTDISTTADGSGIDIQIQSVNKHPTWSPTTLQDDICILKLSSPVQYSDSIRFACLPTSYQGQDLASLLQNPNPSIIGWGSTKVGGGSESRLMQAQVPMVTQATCASAYQGVGQVTIGDTKMCAGSSQFDTCNGDSGGALLSSKLDGAYSVVGITSFGVDCARPGFPGVYTRVDKYLGWINQFL